MYRLLPFLFMLALIPESEKNMEKFHSFVMATKESVASIRSGMETFHATMMPFMAQTADKTNPFSSAGGGEGNNHRKL